MVWSREINVLGVTFMADKDKILGKNYEKLLSNMECTLDPWRARSATLLGKILIVNTLVASQAVYKFLSINTPNGNFFKKSKRMITEFLWNGKKPRVAYKALTQSVENGGLKLIDMEKKDASLKIAWVKRAENTENIWVEIANSILPNKFIQMCEANLKSKDIDKLVNKDSIFNSILKAWAKVHYLEPTNKDEILSQCLWFNTRVRNAKELFVNKEMQSAGISTIRDVFDDHRLKFYEYEELQYSYGNIGNYLGYFKVVESIPKKWKEMLKTAQYDDSERKDMLDILHSAKGATREMYIVLRDQDTYYDHGKVAWQWELDCSWDRAEWAAIRLHATRVSLSTKYRWFQYQVLSKKLVTNVMRNKWDSSISPECGLCKEKSETIIHILWECKIAKSLWSGTQRWIGYICKLEVKFNVREIITNMCSGRYKEFIDTVIIVMKQYIYACKCLGEKPKTNIFLQRLHTLYITERSVAYQNGKVVKMEKKWAPYMDNVVK